LNPPKILCLGLNYVDHAAEQGKAPPEEPTLFMKPRTTIVGPYDDVVKLDWVTQLDYECELAVVIGQGGKNISMDDAFNHVFGYMVFNDVSARDIQFKDRQWTRGKSFDTFAPMGPWITTSDEIDDPHSLKMVTTVNGEVRQNSTTEQMFLKIPQIIHKISKVMTLEPGDVIPTGTPAGVALYLKPSPKFLEKDDVVKLSIDGLGSLENKIISDS
jgi:2-keto-4-pentenoate hydratase/2-oxohepta-3-ene-1,7-dioic acid hydratase in catechol pathway